MIFTWYRQLARVKSSGVSSPRRLAACRLPCQRRFEQPHASSPSASKLHLALVCALGLCALAMSQICGRADDEPSTPNVQGSWNGSFQSTSNPALTGPVSLNITDQDGRRFVGLFLIGHPDFPHSPSFPSDPCRGTISHSSEISLVVEGEAATLRVDGQLTGNVMMLDYEIQSSEGLRDQGSMILTGAGGLP